MRQQKNQPAESPPFFFGAGDKLVDDRLGDIAEIAELRLPQHQGVRIVQAIAVLEAQHPRFGKRAVENLHRSLLGREVLERHPTMTILVIMPLRVSLAESASLSILPAQPHSNPLACQAAKGERFCR